MNYPARSHAHAPLGVAHLVAPDFAHLVNEPTAPTAPPAPVSNMAQVGARTVMAYAVPVAVGQYQQPQAPAQQQPAYPHQHLLIRQPPWYPQQPSTMPAPATMPTQSAPAIALQPAPAHGMLPRPQIHQGQQQQDPLQGPTTMVSYAATAPCQGHQQQYQYAQQHHQQQQQQQQQQHQHQPQQQYQYEYQQIPPTQAAYGVYGGAQQPQPHQPHAAAAPPQSPMIWTTSAPPTPHATPHATPHSMPSFLPASSLSAPPTPAIPTSSSPGTTSQSPVPPPPPPPSTRGGGAPPLPPKPSDLPPCPPGWHTCPMVGCRQQFAHVTDLKAHVIAHAEALVPNSDDAQAPGSGAYTVANADGAYECSLCGRAFKRRADCHRHERSHFLDRPFACSECDKRFTRRETLVKHTQRDHGPGSAAAAGKTPTTAPAQLPTPVATPGAVPVHLASPVAPEPSTVVDASAAASADPWTFTDFSNVPYGGTATAAPAPGPTSHPSGVPRAVHAPSHARYPHRRAPSATSLPPHVLADLLRTGPSAAPAAPAIHADMLHFPASQLLSNRHGPAMLATPLVIPPPPVPASSIRPAVHHSALVPASTRMQQVRPASVTVPRFMAPTPTTGSVPSGSATYVGSTALASQAAATLQSPTLSSCDEASVVAAMAAAGLYPAVQLPAPQQQAFQLPPAPAQYQSQQQPRPFEQHAPPPPPPPTQRVPVQATEQAAVADMHHLQFQAAQAIAGRGGMRAGVGLGPGMPGFLLMPPPSSDAGIGSVDAGGSGMSSKRSTVVVDTDQGPASGSFLADLAALFKVDA
ncbi:hypothetical protein AMAG_14595 [Allomyces macrogynus ATCC 38327]|uniref:C2H2-type domain-containing protein n=1 Tax=Allomyces macrogynus (strain ATCC 38327) TaxID=578462 RepID=A0A0L0T7F4_ALLM3|nr:hypothetical protein AMAG_14595 [Allomyces macrogynus ATCC 38327]|eukprot:KNE70469.1 hypothetical protein AMAG_14595 [Allomyces macrogynus ATCC 38327]